MPPKVKLTKEKVLAAAIDLVRAEGTDALNARSLAAMLGCSTQPIFSNFASMVELKEAVLSASYEIYAQRVREEIDRAEVPPYKASGIAYIRYAKDEPRLFSALFMRDRRLENKNELGHDPVTESALEHLMENTGVSYEVARAVHLELWIFVHGAASMYATGFFTMPLEAVSDMISDVYWGILKYRKEYRK